MSLKYSVFALILTGVTAASLPAGLAHAQSDAPTAQGKSRFSNVLNLTDRQAEYDLAPLIYMTRDQNNALGTREIYKNHRNNLRGDRLMPGPIDLSFQSYAHWMIIDIKNNSRKSEWVLDFGSMADGRTGIFPRIMVNEGQRNTLLLDGLPRAGASNVGQGLNRHTLPISILPGQEVSLVLYIVPSDHTPTVFTPRLIEAGAYMKANATQGIDFQRLIFLLMMGCCAFFAGNMLLRRGLSFFPHTLFFASQGAWFWLASERIFTALPASSHIPGIAMISGGLLALATTQSVVASQDREEGEGVLLYICASFVLMALMAFVFGLPSGSTLRPVVAYGVTALAFLVAAMRAFSIRKDLRFSGIFLGFAWILMLLGTLLPAGAALGYLPADALTLQAHWTVMPLVCVMMIVSGAMQIRANNLGIVRDVLRQAQRAQALNRMKQSQESADQARLMRVIEREREIMDDLRNRDTERTEEMRLAKIAADEANRAKSAFLAVVSHEIRTPMTGIMGMLRLLQDTQLNLQQRDYAHTIKDSGDAMLALLNDILDFSKIESGGMDIEVIDFDLYRVVNSVVMLMSGHAAAKGIYLKAEIPEGTPRYLKGDPTRLRQILLNLVGNALKFTSSGGVTVHIHLGEGKPDAPMGTLPVYFAVADTGIGISPSAQENLFNPFAQADSSIARKFGGTGLGLAICKRLIEAMGSQIQLDSREGEGTTFYFTLNMALGDAQAAEDIDNAGANAVLARVMNVLVVDDNPINRKVIEGLLTRDDHIVTCAESGPEALELMQDQHYDLVLMDIEMPGMDGVTTLHNLRASNAACRDVPIVALTGNTSGDDIERYTAAGMYEVLGKPIDPERMREVLLRLGGPRDGSTPAPAQAATTNVEARPLPDFAKRAAAQNVEATPEHEAMADDDLEMAIEAEAAYTLSDDELDEDSFAQSVEFSEPLSFEVAADAQASEPASITEPSVTHDYVPQPPEAYEPQAPQEAVSDSPPVMVHSIVDDAILQSLKESLGAEQLADMISSVVAHNAQTLPKLQAAFNDADMEGVGAYAHELKGMNANFGLNGISQICARIEHGARHGSLGIDAMDELVFSDLPECLQASERLLMGQV